MGNKEPLCMFFQLELYVPVGYATETEKALLLAMT